MLERPVLLHGRGHRDGEMLDWNCGRRSSVVMDIDINIRQELVMLLGGSGYGGQQQQQQPVIKKSKACMNVELFAQRSSSTTTTTTTTAATSLLQQQQQQQKEQQRPRQQLKPPEEVVACPRCQSLNTKFCYYNNYSLTQPRHFCKNCRRYWTAGGTLRNVPVGGGCRKIKRSSCKSSTTTYHHLHQHQHQQHTAAALAANSDHAAIMYDSPPPPPPGHGFIAHRGILDTFNCDNNTHAAAAAAAVQWLQQQQHAPMSSFATILHDQSKDLELMQVPAAAAGLSSCIDEHRLLHDSQQQQQSLQESCSIMNRLFHSVQQQHHPDAAAVNSSCRHINASGQHHAAALRSSTVGLDDFQSSVNFVDNSSSRCTSRAEAGVCNYNIQLPSERRLVAAAHDQQGNTTTTTLMPSHNDNTNSRAAESWRVALQIPKQEEQEQEEDTTTTTTPQSWPPVHEEHTTLQQAGSLDLNSFKQDHHVKAMKFFHAPSSLSLPSCTHRLGEEEEEEEESKEAQCVEQHERPGAAAPGATAAPAAATASWHHYLYSASQHHVAPGMPQCNEAVTAPPAAAGADTLSSFWSNPSWSHLDLHTLCGSEPGATLL